MSIARTPTEIVPMMSSWVRSSTKNSTVLQAHPTRGHYYHLINGAPHLVMSSPDTFREFQQNYVTDKDEIYILGYPKTGIHFVKKILLEICRHSKGVKDHPHYESINLGWGTGLFWDVVLSPNEGVTAMREGFQASTADDGIPMISFTHSRPMDFPAAEIHPQTKFVYITRDPKDTLISLSAFQQNIWCFFWNHLYDDCKNEFDELFKDVNDMYPLFLSGDALYGCYWEHVKSWWNAKHVPTAYGNKFKPEQILFVYYEDLKANTAAEVAKIHAFLNSDGDGRVSDTKKFEFENLQSDIQSIAERSQFKAVVAELDANPGNFYESSGMTTQQYFRKGVVGDYKSYLSEQQIEAINRKTMLRFADMGIRYWDEVKGMFPASKPFENEWVELLNKHAKEEGTPSLNTL